MPIVKICGVNSVETADAVIRSGAEFAGLVFHPKSPRFVTMEQAHAIVSRIRNRVRIVALVSDSDDRQVQTISRDLNPDYFQLHGNETPQRVEEVRAMSGTAVIKVIGIADTTELRMIDIYEPVADMLMFDAKAPSSATYPGGHGATFDWKILEGVKVQKPWLLAGGLKPENVARAVQMTNAPGVDVSSGVETAPGVKSAEKIMAFISAAKAPLAAEVSA